MGWQDAHVIVPSGIRNEPEDSCKRWWKELHCSRTLVSHKVLQWEDGTSRLSWSIATFYSQRSRANRLYPPHRATHAIPSLLEWLAQLQSLQKKKICKKTKIKEIDNIMQYSEEFKVSVAEGLIAQMMEWVDPTESEDDNVPPRKKPKVLQCEASRKMPFIFYWRITSPMLRGATALDAAWRRGSGVRSLTSTSTPSSADFFFLSSTPEWTSKYGRNVHEYGHEVRCTITFRVIKTYFYV